MLTMQSVSAAQAGSYYEQDDYYTEKGLMPAQWGGELAAKLGLSGPFDQKKFGRALMGQFDGHEFKQKPSPRRAALDTTFSAPKSVSVMALVKGDMRIIEAHDRAVRAAMGRLATLARVRITEDGQTSSVPVTGGIAYASFRHDTSRLGDPNLHTHNTILKAVMGPDGVLRSLDNKEMFRAQREMDATYKAELAQELRAMGYSLIMTKDGFEIEGVSSALIDEFSRRKAQIDAALEAKGMTRETASAEARQAATLDTRNAKKDYDRAELSAWWNDRAAAVAALPELPEGELEHDHHRDTGQRAAESGLASLGDIESNLRTADRHLQAARSFDLAVNDHAIRINAESLAAARDADGLGNERGSAERGAAHDAPGGLTNESEYLAAVADDLAAAGRNLEAAGRLDNDSGEAARTHRADIAEHLGAAGFENRAGLAPGESADRAAGASHTGGPEGSRADRERSAAEVGGILPHRLTPEEALSLALQHFTERESVIKNRHALIAEAIQIAEYRVKASDIDTAVAAAIASGELVVGDRDRLTTRAALEAEKSVDAVFVKGLGACEAMADADFTAQKLAEVEAKLGGQMTEGQRRMVENIATGVDRVMIVEGDAGTGKSTAMEAVKRIADAKGFTVLGLAPSAQAVESLQGAGIDTITSQRAGIDNKFWDRINSKTILVLDEAGLVDVRAMRNILERAEKCGARIVAVGDDKQFASVEAGRALYQLNRKAHEHGRGSRLDEMRRGKNEDMRALHFEARDNPLSSLDKLFAGGQVTTFQNDERRIEALAKAYAAVHQDERAKTLVLTGTNADRVAINAAIREALGRTGGTEIDTFERRDISKVQAKQLASYEIGDVVKFEAGSDGFKKGEMLRVAEKQADKIILERRDGSRVDFLPHRQAESVSIGTEERIAILPGERIRFTAGDKESGIANGDRGVIVAIENDKARIQLDKGKEVVIPLGGKEPLPLRLGYAQTGHSAQGSTATNVLLHVKSSDATADRKSWYTNITRAAVTVHLFTDALESKRLASLRQAISQTKSKELAHEVTGQHRDDDQQKREPLTYIGPAKGWQREDLAADSSDQAIADAMARAQERFGERLHIQGSKKFCERVAEVAAARGIDVKFTDKSMNERMKKHQAETEAKAAPKAGQGRGAAPTAPTGETRTDSGSGQAGKSGLRKFIEQVHAKSEQQRKEEEQQQQKQQQNHDYDL